MYEIAAFYDEVYVNVVREANEWLKDNPHVKPIAMSTTDDSDAYGQQCFFTLTILYELSD